ncbi:hypothetical protein [Paenibacillus sp. MBLB4367]|uniref:hypothetical protein n=1 Tax=Paenibacillus sp. MBLB4367 TaxID=3384767 RepID=UPI00390816C2
MGEGKKTSGDREITYQVGWKRGKIQAAENGSPVKNGNPGGKTPHFVIETRGAKLLRAIWRPVPAAPASVSGALLFALPVISFAVTLWLVYRLSR